MTTIPTPISAKPTKKHHKNNKKNKKHHLVEDFRYLHSDLHELLITQGEEHRKMVKPLKEKKHHLQSQVIDSHIHKHDQYVDQLDENILDINFHTYETHDVADLLEDIEGDTTEDQVIDQAFEDFLG